MINQNPASTEPTAADVALPLAARIPVPARTSVNHVKAALTASKHRAAIHFGALDPKYPKEAGD